jgi:class 3 adenylate cyclase/DNA-binding response OmpR family regulator
MNGNTVLLVDDSDLVAGMVGEALAEAGFDVQRAKDGYEAIEACYRVVPDIVIMDIDMPLLKGYQASRLLKARRGVRDIPIIMHTANTEDKDRFWAYDSGACAFVVKDFTQIEGLVAIVREHIGREAIDLAAIQEDARNLSRETIAEALANMLDKELFHSTIKNQLADAGKSISSLSATVLRVLELLDLACERHVAAVILKFGGETLPYVYPMDCVNKEMADDFVAVALEDFYGRFERDDLRDTFYFNTDQRTDWTKIHLGKTQLCSYYHVPIPGSGGEPIGSLHVANLKNNYFSETIVEALASFVSEAGVIIQNSMLYRKVATMEREIRNVFSKFVPQEIIDDLVTRKTRTSMLAGEKRELTIVFSDIRSFTTLSETNPPEVVVSFLNRYLETMCEIITERGGMVDKFIGDAILAVFGAPQSWPDNALRAVETALAMSRALAGFDTAAIKLPPGGLDIGIGIHLGDAIVGTIGSSSKFDYTVIGDTVNLASRLEGLSKQYHARTIVSGRVVEEIRSQRLDHPHFKFREIEEVIVKGKEEPTVIYMLEDESNHWLEAAEYDLYKKGLSMYRLRNWKLAADYFGAVLASKPGDPISAMYLERCEDFRTNPPPEDWDLVQRYVTK